MLAVGGREKVLQQANTRDAVGEFGNRHARSLAHTSVRGAGYQPREWNQNLAYGMSYSREQVHRFRRDGWTWQQRRDVQTARMRSEQALSWKSGRRCQGLENSGLGVVRSEKRRCKALLGLLSIYMHLQPKKFFPVQESQI